MASTSVQYNPNLGVLKNSEVEPIILNSQWTEVDEWKRSPDWNYDGLQGLVCSKPGRLLMILFIVLLIYINYIVITSNHSFSMMDVKRLAPGMHVNSTNRAVGILMDLCNSFNAGIISGDSCNRLCYKRNWTIIDYHEGNKIVLILKDGGQTTVLKSKYPSMSDYVQYDRRLTYEEFTDKVLSVINDELRLGWPRHYKKHLMEILWPTLRRTPGEPVTEADQASLWSLLQQSEFVLFRILPLTRVTPKIIGTCGHFYSTESLVAFKMKEYYMNLKGKILVHIMGTLKLLYEFFNEPLQWCDVRFDNLGLSADYPKRFLLMDGDMVYTESGLRAALRKRHCSTDDDCTIGDCKARCASNMMCSGRSDSNLEVFCEKLVNKLFGHNHSSQNRYLMACQESYGNATERLSDLRLVWSWNLFNV